MKIIPGENDHAIIAGLILTMDSDRPMIRDGAVVIHDDIIAWVGKARDLGDISHARVIEQPGVLMMPGLVNCHTHLPMALFRGLADDLPLDQWLNDHIFPAEAAGINGESARKWALHSARELLLSGVTTCCDGYFHEDDVAGAVLESGIRAVLGQGIIDFPAPGVPDPSTNVDYAKAFAERWLDRSTRIRPSLFCHSPYTCSEQTLKHARQVARSLGILFQIHVAETCREKSMIPGRTGLSPIAYLDSLGILDPDTVLVHCVWLDATDRRILKQSGAAVVHCPESNMKLASGVAPVPDLIRAGIRTGLGTDGSASNNNLDLFREMHSASVLHKAALSDPRAMDDYTLVHMATLGGAKVLGMDQIIGSISPGKKADLILINLNQPHLVPVTDPWYTLVNTVKGADVTDVFVDGRHRVTQGKLTPVTTSET